MQRVEKDATDQQPDRLEADGDRSGGAADPAQELPSWMVEGGEMIREAYTPRRDDDDFGQPGTLWREVLSDTDRDHLVDNIVGHASAPEVKPETKERVVAYWRNVDGELGSRVADGLGIGRSDGSTPVQEPVEAQRAG